MLDDKVLQQAIDAQHERMCRIGKAWDAYNGTLPKPLKVKPGATDDNIRLNFAGVIVDTGVSFLFGDDLTFEVDKPGEGTEGETEKSPADEWLEDAWKQNRLMTFLLKVGINGGVTGDVYIKLVPPEGQYKFPRLILWDPVCVTPIYDQDDIDNVLAYVYQWNIVDPNRKEGGARRQVVEQNDGGETWQITDYVSYGMSKTWEQVDTVTWPYPWCPVFHAQNLPAPNEFWGRSDLEADIVEVNSAINFVMSNTGRILRFHAHPKTWGKGFTAKEFNAAVDGLTILPSKDASLANLEMQGSIADSLEFYKKLKEAGHEIAAVPEIATGKVDSIGALSGLALQILYRPLLQKTGKKRRLYGDLLADINQRMLELGKQADGATVETHWPNPLPTDSQEEADTAVTLNGLGVSKATLLARLGYDPEMEAEKKAEETSAEQDMAQTMLTAFEQGKGKASSGNTGA